MTSFSDSEDLTGKTGRFREFVVGKAATKPIVKPYGVGLWEDRIYVCDTMLGALVVMDLADKSFTYLAPKGMARLSKPINIAIDVDGTKYVADTGRNAVVILDGQDNYAGLLAAEDEIRPTDVVVGNDRVYITDLLNSRVGVWSKARRELLYWIPREESAQARLYSPVNLALDGEGNLYVSDIGAFRVQKYDREGKYLRSFGSLGDAPGQFVRPKGIDVDSEGRLYVADAGSQVVQIFDPDGNLLMFFGEPHDERFILSLPTTVRVNESLIPFFSHLAHPSFELEQLLFVVSQYGAHKISVFGMGTWKE